MILELQLYLFDCLLDHVPVLIVVIALLIIFCFLVVVVFIYFLLLFIVILPVIIMVGLIHFFLFLHFLLGLACFHELNLVCCVNWVDLSGFLVFRFL